MSTPKERMQANRHMSEMLGELVNELMRLSRGYDLDENDFMRQAAKSFSELVSKSDFSKYQFEEFRDDDRAD